jgi:para-aminobenzoate synthetase component 1
MTEPCAQFGDYVATDLLDVSHDPGVLDSQGWWAAVLPYDGEPIFARFGHIAAGQAQTGRWVGPEHDAWSTSMSRQTYIEAVQTTREYIAAGEVYQANICRVMSAALADPSMQDITGLAALLTRGNPSPYGGFLQLPAGCHPGVPAGGVHIATASPELFLRRDGDVIESGPIKGTGKTSADLAPKDSAENVMIVDLVRNDLSVVCRTGSVTVPKLLTLEEHPGLVHLVSYVRGELRQGTRWPELLDASFPPGSVTGAPKSSALRIIDELEPASRGPYCGAMGWVNADDRTAEMAVTIRTFWIADGAVHFGTGAGITWGSDPVREWEETELKRAKLLTVAGGIWDGGLS